MSEEYTEPSEVKVEVPVAEVAQVAALRAKLLQAELRTAAARAGMIDLDGVKLVDSALLRVNEAGELVEGSEVMTRLKEQKPWLFGRPSNTSASAVAPRATPPKAKTAMEMSVEEWRVARAELLRRR